MIELFHKKSYRLSDLMDINFLELAIAVSRRWDVSGSRPATAPGSLVGPGRDESSCPSC